MAKERPGITIPANIITEEEINDYSDQELGALFRAILTSRAYKKQGAGKDLTRELKHLLRSAIEFDKVSEASFLSMQRGGQKAQKNRQVSKPLETPLKPLQGVGQIEIEKEIEIEREIDKEKDTKKKGSAFASIIEDYTQSIPLQEALRDFIESRKKMRSPMTEKALKLMLSKLSTLTQSEDEAITILNQSIEHGWKTVYPLKKDELQQKKDSHREKLLSLMEWAEEEDDEKGNISALKLPVRKIP